MDKTLLKMAVRALLLPTIALTAVTIGAALLYDSTGNVVWALLLLGGVATVCLVVRRFL